MKRKDAPAATSPYRKLEVATWTDQRFGRLSRPQPNAQSLWVYLLAGPRTMNIPGVVVAREAVIADDLRWPLEGFRDAFGEVMREGMVEADWDAGVLVLSKAFFDGRGQPRSVHRPQSINVVIGWAKRWDEIPECALKDRFYRALRGYLKAIGDGYEDAFAKACPEPSPIQEQEQKQEQKEVSAEATPRRTIPSRAKREQSSEEPKAQRKRERLPTPPDSARPPLPFSIRDLGAALARGAGAAFAPDSFDHGLAKPVTAVIRSLAEAGRTLEDIEAAGRVVAAWKLAEPVTWGWVAKAGNLTGAVAKALTVAPRVVAQRAQFENW